MKNVKKINTNIKNKCRSHEEEWVNKYCGEIKKKDSNRVKSSMHNKIYKEKENVGSSKGFVKSKKRTQVAEKENKDFNDAENMRENIQRNEI